MTENNLTKALMHYRLLEEQKKEIETRQAKLKKMIDDHMKKRGLDKLEVNGIMAFYSPKNTYEFEVEKIVAALPESIRQLKITNDVFERLLKGNEDKIGTFRRLAKQEVGLVIRVSK